MVYKVEEKKTNLIFAAKATKCADEEIIRMCKAEHDMMKQVDHPNIARVVDLISNELTGTYLIMEYVLYPSLKQ